MEDYKVELIEGNNKQLKPRKSFCCLLVKSVLIEFGWNTCQSQVMKQRYDKSLLRMTGKSCGGRGQ